MADKITRWLHLSDMHFLLDNDTTMMELSRTYEDFFIKYRENHHIDKEAPLFDIVFITGDLHDSSGKNQNNINYKQSLDFLNKFITEWLHVDKKNVFIVPGNHDAVYPLEIDESGNIFYKMKDGNYKLDSSENIVPENQDAVYPLEIDESGNIFYKKKDGNYKLYSSENKDEEYELDSSNNKIPKISHTRRAKFERYAEFINLFYCDGCNDKNKCNWHKCVKKYNFCNNCAMKDDCKGSNCGYKKYGFCDTCVDKNECKGYTCGINKIDDCENCVHQKNCKGNGCESRKKYGFCDNCSDRKICQGYKCGISKKDFCDNCEDKNNCRECINGRNKYIRWSEEDFSGEYVVTWSEMIGKDTGPSMHILHLNTASYYADVRPSDDKNDGNAVIDYKRGKSATAEPADIPNDAPAIIISHNPYPHLDNDSRELLKSICIDAHISAHLCGDVHQRDLFEIKDTDVKSICGAKMSSDKKDEWSDFGFIIYEWNHKENYYNHNDVDIITEGKVTVYPYSWNVKSNTPEEYKKSNKKFKRAPCGIQKSPDFRANNDDGEYFFWLKKRGDTPQGIGTIREEYINPINHLSNAEHWDIFQNIIKVLAANKNKLKVLVIGDVMLDFVETCKRTGIGQNKSHDIKYSFDMKNESARLGGAANVATMFTEVSDDVRLFGVAGGEYTNNDEESKNKNEQVKGENKEIKWDIFGEKLIDLADETFGHENVHIFPIKEYLTVTKLYLKEIAHIGTHVRINRELKGKFGRLKIHNYMNQKNQGMISDSEIFLTTFTENLKDVDIIILKDHEKGLLNTPEGVSNDFLEKIIKLINLEYAERKNRVNIGDNNENNKELIIILDPKHKWNCFDKLEHINAIILNVEEMAAMLYPENKKIWSECEAVSKLYIPEPKILFDKNKWWNDSNKVDCVVMTEGKNGASYYRPNKIDDNNPNFELSIPGIDIRWGYKSEIGAGCILLAYFTACLFSKNEIMNICDINDSEFYQYALKLANYAAARSCTKDVSRQYSIAELASQLLSMDI